MDIKYLHRILRKSDDRYVYVVQNEERRMMRFVRMRQISDESGGNAVNGNEIGMKNDDEICQNKANL